MLGKDFLLQKQCVVLMGEIIKGLGGNIPLQQMGKGRAVQESAVELDSVGAPGRLCVIIGSGQGR